MGAVHNPSGAGVAATSSFVKAKVQKIASISSSPPGDGVENPRRRSRGDSISSTSETNKAEKEAGSSKRNIQRKKSAYAHESKFKKQGGHGKSAWNKYNHDESDYYDAPVDRDDPNYDSEEDDGRYILTSDGYDIGANPSSPPRYSYDPSMRKMIAGPRLTLSEFKIRASEAISEYFTSGEVEECLRSVEELECREFHYEVVKRAVHMSFDRGDRERELTSKLLSTAYPDLLTTNDIGKGFERLFEHLESYILDVPSANEYVCAFLARAVVDEVLPPSFLSDPLVRSIGGSVINVAMRLLSREHCSVRLERVWGPGDGRPVADLKIAMDQLLKEFLLSHELDEAAVCVKELNSPHFHHELVKRGVKIALGGKDDDVAAMSALFKFLNNTDVLSSTQMRKGLDRCYSLLPDFSLDCPTAPNKLRTVLENAIRDEIVDSSYQPPEVPAVRSEVVTQVVRGAGPH